ncbi:TetR/AcrR family transcriptional regulator [Candidatus Nitronereus thalassa]|uniref:TetR/AcrR family transcriptional regulator n=1 Tax=Candidatus Nitronereus thalassa TaxID=3020898 RepID=A0ABU3K8H2_9BACT|nr:TetR/AcrR family transcriptional regulator [Candidatus Nitronereus thalassa]MDT7042695.1 TetR/AcrR family transcriptional regulator [Candidatus Nitronereus thalassa]
MDPRTKRKQREYEARRQEILSAAECLFSKNGFFKTSMAEIAQGAQFAMGTVYRFFKSKEEIYISIVEAKVEELAELLDEEIALVKTPSDKIQAFIRVKLDYADRHRDFFRIYVSEWSGYEWTIKSAFGERVWKLYMAQVDLVADLIKEGIRRKEFRKIDPKDAALALHGMLNSTMYVWILQAKPSESLIDKRNLISTLFLNGIQKESKPSYIRRVV